MSLRPYQQKAVEEALHALARSGSAVLQMPTGAGKTKAATEIIKRHAKPVLFICHRQEIERQASAAFAAAGIDHGIISPRAEPDYNKPVQIASIGTLALRLANLPKPSLTILDECHHTPSPSWVAVREALSESQHLGLTATPERLDGKGLSEWFNELVVGPSTRELIDGGWLSDFRYFAPSEPDLTGARLQAGDYHKKDLAKAMNSPVLIGDAIAEYQKQASGKRALAFCASIEASQELVRRFNDAGIAARHVGGKTPTDERIESVRMLAAGEIKVLSNVGVFTEGFDLPAVDAAILLRPTKSLTLYLQMVGRVLRRAEGKNEALIFDHAGLWLEPTLGFPDEPRDWQITGGVRAKTAAGRSVGPRRCPECKEVRAERVEVCSCGYEFPTGREIGEYDGQLMELRSAVPEGWETLSAFGRRIGRSPSGVRLLIGRGMPSDGCHIHVEAAIEWLRLNPLRGAPPTDVDDPHEYVSPNAFAAEIGISESSIPRLGGKGLPRAGNGWVHRRLGLEFIQKYESSHSSLGLKEKGEFVPVIHFAKMVGVSAPTVNWCINQGMPAAANNWVNPTEANAWMRANFRSKKNRPFDVNDPHNYEVGPKFAARFGFGSSAVNNWRKQGLPCASNGWVNVPLGIEWVRGHIPAKLIPPQDVEHPADYEKPTDFERRVGAKGGASWRWPTIPRASNGWIHVRDGLAWYEQYIRHPRRRGVFGDISGCEPKMDFCIRIGFRGAASFEKGQLRRMPIEPNGWVHIQRGLEWVRDNTNIQIPPGAWPTANDNAASAQAEAA